MNTFSLFHSLRNPTFARLYAAQTTNLIGDALTWVGLALLAFELAGKDSGIVLSGALTLRVSAFVLLSPLAGAIADRFDRKRIMVVTHLARMLIVSLLLFVSQVWQIYAIVLALNVFYAFFTPTYTATIPLVTGSAEYPQAIALSSATFQLLGVLGPGLAGAVAAFIGARQVFFLDALSFLVAAMLLVTLPGELRIDQNRQSVRTVSRTLQDIKAGTTRLFADAPIRYALAMQLVASITGAQILVNTVGYVQGTLALGKVEYGWVMAVFGIGATLASIAFGNFNQRFARTTFIGVGAALISLALLPANSAGLVPLMLLWLMAGVGQSWVNLPTQTLIADRIPTEFQGRVYGAHFAWSHLWWAFAYPIAGWLGSHQPTQMFFYGSLIGLVLLVTVQLTLSHPEPVHRHESYWHDHEHRHDESHQHKHHPGILASEPHTHPHQHAAFRHVHLYAEMHHHGHR
ncbi:MFS transporter [Microcoleus sp. FACHB-1515]|uniref:MFS transporter n=1 Tax=Cyanophyceae TaxID=3028117 RepID=UPI0016876D0D|nr:MFS transporter [Microcoleus sp. FACHB-1515]MBD2093214.1 MFS transporter [Microcoleus sp. FACHB-1515]